jgi:hypothetical protein
MITNSDKAFAVIIAAIALWLNQKYGFALPTDANVWFPVVGAILAAVTWAVPNKPKGT